MYKNMCLQTWKTNAKFSLRDITSATIFCYSIPVFMMYYYCLHAKDRNQQ